MMTALMIAITVLANSAGDVFIARGMKKVGEVSTLSPRELVSICIRVLRAREILLGLLFLIVSFAAFLLVLTWADMSFVVPLTSIVYVVTAIGAKFFLKEEVNGLRWAGVLFVCLGVALICVP